MIVSGGSTFLFLGKTTHLPLSREVTVASGDTEEDGIELGEVIGVKDGIVGLGGRIHLGQDFLRECLGNPDNQSSIRQRGRDDWKEMAHTGR